MLVCICKAVSDRRIREEINRGARTLSQVRQACAAGSDCGSCVHQIRELIATHTNGACERHARQSVGG